MFFSSFCLCFAALGQAIGAETEVETRLVYVVLEGEPASEVAVRLRDRGLAKREIAEATRERIAEIATQQDQLVARLGQVQGTVEAQFSRLANAVKVRLPLDQAKRLRQLDGVVAVKPVAQFHFFDLDECAVHRRDQCLESWQAICDLARDPHRDH